MAEERQEFLRRYDALQHQYPGICFPPLFETDSLEKIKLTFAIASRKRVIAELGVIFDALL
uniref:Uncharacterized protein n=1 Tax=Marseillevirus LCMAC103 TaxID=2506604 RepID=A0A481YUP6_9VIRU|nr:MAG: uncharacterized protein LCMAC103_00810 [Marseillevirus LCMAC103]